MANTLMTLSEVYEELVQPFLDIVQASMRDLPPGVAKEFRNPCGRDLLPLRFISGESTREGAD
jgi:hypothetical protein